MYKTKVIVKNLAFSLPLPRHHFVYIIYLAHQSEPAVCAEAYGCSFFKLLDIYMYVHITVYYVKSLLPYATFAAMYS